jgi:SAM-dependent methyltransferase
MRPLIKLVIALIALPYVLVQVRKPTKWVGRFFVTLMNVSHSRVTDWGLSHIRVEKQFTILDVGCGGGRTVQKMSTLASEGMVYGVDYSAGSVAVAGRENAPLIEAGRVEIKQASVSQLPFPEDKFDLVTAVETQYYWPDLVNDMKEVLRVLKPGGTLVVIAETYKNGRFDKLQWPVLKLLRATHLGVEDQRKLFAAAGYVDVQVVEERHRGWICAIGRKPSRHGGDPEYAGGRAIVA